MEIEISEKISPIRMTKFNIFTLLYLLTCSFILLFIIKNMIFSVLLVILIIAFIIYRKILIKKIKGKIKIFITDSVIEMISPKIRKINYSDIKNIAYIQNNSYGDGDVIINISPLKIENKYIDLFSKNDYTFAESINYRTFIIPDAKNVKEIFQKIIERKKQNEILTKMSEDRKRRIEIYSNNIIAVSSKVNNSEIIFYDEVEYNEEKDEIKVKRMGITNKYLNEIGLPSLKLWKKEKDLRELSALEVKQYLESMERNGGKKKEW